MINETTPQVISAEIMDFCRSITTEDPDPIFVPVIPEGKYIGRHCFENVEDKVAISGGMAVTGWIIWQRGNMYLDAEAHSIWRSDQGELTDITPKQDNENEILFLSDPSIRYEGFPIQSRFYALTESVVVAKCIESMQTMQAITSKMPANTENTLTKENGLEEYKSAANAVRDFEFRVNVKVGRNDLCPCGSGIKYKKCCLRFSK